MGKLRVHNIEAQTGNNVDLGAVSDVVTLASDSIQTNLYKDSGANTIFQSNGSGTLSNVNSGLSGAGGPTLILSQTATTGTANISFTANIDSTYDLYMFVFIGIHPSVDAARLDFQGSTNGGSSYGVELSTTAYTAYQPESGSGTLTYASSRDQGSGTTFQELTSGIGTDNDQNAAGILYLYSPASTTYMKNWCSRTNTYEAGNYSQEYFMSGFFNTATAINAIRFQMHTGNIDDGTIKMYGIA